MVCSERDRRVRLSFRNCTPSKTWGCRKCKLVGVLYEATLWWFHLMFVFVIVCPIGLVIYAVLFTDWDLMVLGIDLLPVVLLIIIVIVANGYFGHLRRNPSGR